MFSAGGRGYFASQIVLCSVGAVAGLGVGPYVIATSDDPGYGLIFFLGGVGCVISLIWLIRQVVGKTPEEKAVYAWAIMQQQSVRSRGGAAVVSSIGGVAAMITAARARDGKLSLREVERLQAMRPDVPFPGTLPPAPTARDRGRSTLS